MNRSYPVMNILGQVRVFGPLSGETIGRLCDAVDTYNRWRGFEGTETGGRRMRDAAADMKSIIDGTPPDRRQDAIRQIGDECPNAEALLNAVLRPAVPPAPPAPTPTPSRPAEERGPGGVPAPPPGPYVPPGMVPSVSRLTPIRPPPSEPAVQPPPVTTPGPPLKSDYERAVEEYYRKLREAPSVATAFKPIHGELLTPSEAAAAVRKKYEEPTAAPPPVRTPVASTACPPGQFWDGTRCRGPVGPVGRAGMLPGLLAPTGGGMFAPGGGGGIPFGMGRIPLAPGSAERLGTPVFARPIRVVGH